MLTKIHDWWGNDVKTCHYGQWCPTNQSMVWNVKNLIGFRPSQGWIWLVFEIWLIKDFLFNLSFLSFGSQE